MFKSKTFVKREYETLKMPQFLIRLEKFRSRRIKFNEQLRRDAPCILNGNGT